MSSILASIDLGSNTVRILVVRKKGSGFEPIYSNQEITRLSEGLAKTGNLISQAIDRTVRAIGKLKTEAALFNPDAIWIAATSAVRTANNREAFISQVKSETGLEVEVIPWEEEGRKAVLGVRYGLKNGTENCLVFDIGGGSTEFIYFNNGAILASAGTDLGVVRLSERYLTKDIISKEEFLELNKEINIKIQEVGSKIDIVGEPQLVGTAGTVTTIAALDLELFPYDPEKINGYKLGKERIDSLLNNLRNMTCNQIRDLPPVENGREDLIVAGITIVKNVMEIFGFNEIVVSDYGLREGILLGNMGWV